MKNLHTELDELKRSLKLQSIMFVIAIILSAFSCLICYNLGYVKHEKEIIERAKNLPENADCYNNTDIENLIFGEPQL